MRLISPVAIDEVFLSSGVYLYYRDEQLLDMTEAWTIHRTPDNWTVTRVERNAPAFGALVLVEARQSEMARDIEQIEVHWWNQTPGAVGVAAASYSIEDGVIDCLRWVDGSELVRESILTPPTLVVSPLMRIFLGSVLPKVAEMGEATIFAPWLHDPMDAERLLTVDLERRRASLIGHEAVEVEGETYATSCYSYRSRDDDDDDAARYWINDAGVLVRYIWKGWDVHLAEYRTETAQFEEDETPYPFASSNVFSA